MLPTYAMSSFLLSLEICKKLARAIAHSGGVQTHPNKECAGQHGINYENRNMKEALDSD